MIEALIPITIGLSETKKIEIRTVTGNFVDIMFFYLDYKSEWQIDNGMQLAEMQSEMLIQAISKTLERMKILRGDSVEIPKKPKRNRKVANKNSPTLVSQFCPDFDVS